VGSLTDVQKSIIIGSLLGDGYMRCKRNAYLQICHSIKQKMYVDWKYSFLKQYVKNKPKAYQGNGIRVGYRFYTKALPIFTPIYRIFYPAGAKILPDNIVLDPTILAIWYMDDGSRNRRSAYLNTQQFSMKDQKKIVLLLKKYGFESNLNKDGKYHRVRFYQQSAQKLKHMIQIHMPRCMHYKLPL
jgi:hypothetical protein